MPAAPHAAGCASGWGFAWPYHFCSLNFLPVEPEVARHNHLRYNALLKASSWRQAAPVSCGSRGAGWWHGCLLGSLGAAAGRPRSAQRARSAWAVPRPPGPRHQLSHTPPTRTRCCPAAQEMAPRYGALVDIHAHFLAGERSWLTGVIEPSLEGASEASGEGAVAAGMARLCSIAWHGMAWHGMARRCGALPLSCPTAQLPNCHRCGVPSFPTCWQQLEWAAAAPAASPD